MKEKTIQQFLSRINPFALHRVVLLWIVLGLVGGLVAGLYWIVLEFMMHGMHAITGWKVIPLMTISGLLAGLVIHFIGDPGEIHLLVNNIRFKKGKLEPKNNPSMVLSSLLCVASGGSLGPEAPLVQVTGSIGTWIGEKLRLTGEELRSTSIAGMAAGFTALFGAPLGGSLFANEILHHRHATTYYKAMIPAFVASCCSYLVFAIITHLNLGPTWNFPAYELTSKFDFVYAVLFALVATATGWLFIYWTKGLLGVVDQFQLPIYIKTTAGGLGLGILAYYFPLTRYFGHHEINTVLSSEMTLSVLGILLLMKIVAISLTVVSGWRGGFIIPLFFVGTCLGMMLHQVFPSVSLSLTVISCMAAINACVTRTPMSTTILLAGMTGFDYFVPVLFASLTGYFLAPKHPFISSQKEKEAEHNNTLDTKHSYSI